MGESPMSAGARRIGRIALRPALKNRHRIAVPRLLFRARTAVMEVLQWIRSSSAEDLLPEVATLI